MSTTTMPVAAENRAALDALFSYRVCAVSFNKLLKLTGLSVPALPLAPAAERRYVGQSRYAAGVACISVVSS
jgi:hypothetical protein